VFSYYQYLNVHVGAFENKKRKKKIRKGRGGLRWAAAAQAEAR
jgi:hypothetical protein